MTDIRYRNFILHLGIAITFVVLFAACGGRRAAIKEMAEIQVRISDEIHLPAECEIRSRIADMESDAGSIADTVAVRTAIDIADSLINRKEYSRLARYVNEVMPLVRRFAGESRTMQAKTFELQAYLYEAYRYLGLNDRAIKGLIGDIALAERMQLKDVLALLNNNLSTFYKSSGMLDEAITISKRSLKLNEELNDSSFLVYNYNNLASIYLDKKDYHKAIEYSFMALHYIPQSDSLLRMLVQRNISTKYTYLDEYGMARKQLEPVIKFFERTGNVPELTYSYARYAFILWKTGETAPANRYFQKALATIERCDKEIQQNIARNYADFCHATGNKDQELAALRKSIEIAEGLNKESSTYESTSLGNLQKYEMEQADRAARITRENRHKFYLWVSILSAVAAAAILTALFIAARGRRRAAAMQAELSTMREQLHRAAVDSTASNELIAKLSRELQELQRSLRSDTKAHQMEKLRKLTSLVMRNDNKDKLAMNAANVDFFRRLVEKYPVLTSNDLRLAGMLRQGMSSKDIAEVMVKEVRSVETARNRLRKKINIPSDVDLCRFFMEI